MSDPSDVSDPSDLGDIGVQILAPREVPLGGLRAMTVRRTLPQRARTTVGPWCFCDHYGPDDLATSEPMVVPPHPHTGLATVSWLFSGAIEHRDSAGHHAVVRPGELNLMTAGRGISHSEYSTADTRILHGVQLWLVLPDTDRDCAPALAHDVPRAIAGEGWTARVFLGRLLGSRAATRTHAPVVGAELSLTAGTRMSVPVDPAFEHGLLVDHGTLDVTIGTTAVSTRLEPHHLGYVEPGTHALELSTRDDVRMLLLGGAPFTEPLVMWWNFIGRDHDEIAEYRAQWEQTVRTGHGDRFGLPTEDPREPLPAPALPGVRLRARG